MTIEFIPSNMNRTDSYMDIQMLGETVILKYKRNQAKDINAGSNLEKYFYYITKIH